MENLLKKYQKLYDSAFNARLNAYAPYSKFQVGAAALLKDGNIITGFNIENASYGLCNCGERNTLFRCYMEGYKKEDILALLIIASTPKPVSPCGACRQVMAELMNKDAIIVLANTKGELEETTVEKLLPYSFEGDDMGNV